MSSQETDGEEEVSGRRRVGLAVRVGVRVGVKVRARDTQSVEASILQPAVHPRRGVVPGKANVEESVLGL